jgi:hypothetical protein
MAGDPALHLRDPTAGDPALHIGAGGDDRTATLSARTRRPRAALALVHSYAASLSARTRRPTAHLAGFYDPNLLSPVFGTTATSWREGLPASLAGAGRFQSAEAMWSGGVDRWRPSWLLIGSGADRWRFAARADGAGIEAWRDGDGAANGAADAWRGAPFVVGDRFAAWRDAAAVARATVSRFRVRLPLHVLPNIGAWNDGRRETLGDFQPFSEGLRRILAAVERWRQAGYPANARRPRPNPPPRPHPWTTRLRLHCPLPGTRLRLGKAPCILLAEREIPARRSYMTVNSASLVRWPDLTPLPVTALTVETDFDSWCWSLSATLAGPDAYPLVQPNPLACEVLATINGHAWKFLLDVPNRTRQFNQDRVSLKGRSRSAWLQAPYTPKTSGVEANPREMQQLAEAALENLGWTLVWDLENWVVPAGVHAWNGTPIDRLMQLVGATGDGLYTDPAVEIITAYRRWPVVPWLLDGEIADVAVPDAAILSLTQTPTYTPAINGVYVSGTTHGTLALVKIAGTDGAIQPAEPLVHELLCDEAGVAARQRGLNALADAGSGLELDAELLLVEPVGVIRPGLIVSLAGIKGVSRGVRIAATWADGLRVRQTVGLERRED